MRLALVLAYAVGIGTVPARADDKTAIPRVTAAQLVETFLTNEALADERYVGKPFELTGTLVRISRSKYPPQDGESPGYVMELDVGGAGKGELDLVIFFGSGEREQLARLKVGQPVRLTGRCAPRVLWSGDARKGQKDYSEVQVREAKLVDSK